MHSRDFNSNPLLPAKDVLALAEVLRQDRYFHLLTHGLT